MSALQKPSAGVLMPPPTRFELCIGQTVPCILYLTPTEVEWLDAHRKLTGKRRSGAAKRGDQLRWLMSEAMEREEALRVPAGHEDNVIPFAIEA